MEAESRQRKKNKKVRRKKDEVKDSQMLNVYQVVKRQWTG
jgi:hypothetical protein